MSDDHVIGALEPDQLTAAASRKLGRRKLSGLTLFLLYALRVYVVLAIPVVVYAFLRALHG